jgi:hypothetical protein
MAAKNLRVVYQNLINIATTTTVASTTASNTSAANLKLDSKGSVWRSTGTTATITVTFAIDQVVSAVIAPFCNLTTSSTISFICKNAAGTQVATSGTVLCAPFLQITPSNWGTTPQGVSTYAYGGGTCARAYLPNNTKVTCRSVEITITDTSNADGYIELARLIVGDYWSPQYNTSFGLSTNTVDLSENLRTESGNLVTNRGTQFKKMSFELSYLTPTDRQSLNAIIKGNGIAKAIFISLFPENSVDYDVEGLHQIYGKLSQLSAITYSHSDIYNTSIELEEV